MRKRRSSSPFGLPIMMARLTAASLETIFHRTNMMAKGTCSPAEYQRMVAEKAIAAQRSMVALMRRYVAAATGEIGVVLLGRSWQESAGLVLSAGQHGATLPAFSFGTLPERCQDHAHVRQRGGERVPAPALARHRRQTGLSGLWLHDLLRVSAIDHWSALALQGVPR